MPAIQFFMTKNDLGSISNWLCEKDHIALIRSNGSAQWKADRTFDLDGQGRWCLYHDLCGPLTLLAQENSNQEDGIVDDPYAGWIEKRAGANPANPYFGSGHTAIFWFNVGRDIECRASLSSFEWLGDHYSDLGRKAPEMAKKFWQSLRRFILKSAVKVNMSGARTDDRSPYWATPDAMRDLDARNPGSIAT